MNSAERRSEFLTSQAQRSVVWFLKMDESATSAKDAKIIRAHVYEDAMGMFNQEALDYLDIEVNGWVSIFYASPTQCAFNSIRCPCANRDVDDGDLYSSRTIRSGTQRTERMSMTERMKMINQKFSVEDKPVPETVSTFGGSGSNMETINPYEDDREYSSCRGTKGK